MSSCYCDYEPAELYRPTRPKARKEHRCDECGGTIQPGERYESATGVWSGMLETFRTCSWCLGIRDLVELHMDCFCWQHGTMLEEAVDTVRNEYNLPGFKMKVGAQIVEARRNGWKGIRYGSSAR